MMRLIVRFVCHKEWYLWGNVWYVWGHLLLLALECLVVCLLLLAESLLTLLTALTSMFISSSWVESSSLSLKLVKHKEICCTSVQRKQLTKNMKGGLLKNTKNAFIYIFEEKKLRCSYIYLVAQHHLQKFISCLFYLKDYDLSGVCEAFVRRLWGVCEAFVRCLWGI